MGDSHRNSANWPTSQWFFWSTLMPHIIKPTAQSAQRQSTKLSKTNKNVLLVRTTAGNTSHSRISGTRTFPFFLASRMTIASLSPPEHDSSHMSVPRISPINRRPWISGVHSAYAVGRYVITERTHQYLQRLSQPFQYATGRNVLTTQSSKKPQQPRHSGTSTPEKTAAPHPTASDALPRAPSSNSATGGFSSSACRP